MEIELGYTKTTKQIVFTITENGEESQYDMNLQEAQAFIIGLEKCIETVKKLYEN